MADRASSLAGHYPRGRHGLDGQAGVMLCDMPDLLLQQVSAWPETLAQVGAEVAQTVGLATAPGPGQASAGSAGTLLRVEPLKWWLYGTTLVDISPDVGCLLDLSHARTHVRVSGPDAATCLNRHLPVDLRDGACPVGSVVSTALHHVAVALWRSEHGFELFLPRGFALSCWEVLLETAEQFGVEVV